MSPGNNTGQWGSKNEFCISSQKESPDAITSVAIAACQSKNPSMNLCDENQWIRACNTLPAANNFFVGAPERNTTAGSCRGRLD